MPAIDIIQACTRDAEEILALQRIAYQSEAMIYPDITLPPMTQTLEEMAAQILTITVLKAMAEDEIVGSVRAELTDSVCRIGRLIVSPACQGQGIGSMLMTAVEQAFSQADRFELFTGEKSLANLKFYKNRGYQPCRSQRVSPGLTLVFLEKRP